jgi:hypothetical protein
MGAPGHSELWQEKHIKALTVELQNGGYEEKSRRKAVEKSCRKYKVGVSQVDVDCLKSVLKSVRALV